MTIAEISSRDVLADCRLTLGLPTSTGQPLDDVFLAAILRHCAGYYCPCSRATLRTAVADSLQYLSESSLTDRIDAAVEGLVVVGDLLELSDVATDDPDVKGTWLFAAPPSFVVRPGGSIFLVGAVRDLSTFLPQALAARIVYEGFSRVILPEQGEDLRSELREQGLQDLSEAAWLKAPRPETAEKTVKDIQQRLALQPASGAIEDLQILDSNRTVIYYAGRWAPPLGHEGTFVAKRPQDYGAPIWCVVSLEAGKPTKLLDFPLKRSRWRGCDIAWHLQMAIDASRQAPQRYRRRRANSSVDLHFFSPLPQWAERRLMIFGHQMPREHSLFSYSLSVAEADSEERFLRQRLWLMPTEDSN